LEFVEPIRDRKKIKAIKKVLMASNMRNYILFTLGINSGLKVCDLLKLKVSDVLDEKGEIKELITDRDVETGKNKTFPLNDKVIETLKKYLVDAQPEEYLFASRYGGGPITRQHAHRIICDAAKKVGIKDKIGTQTLRKTFEYHLYYMYHKGNMDVTRDLTAFKKSLRYFGIITQDKLDNLYLKLEL